MYEKFLTCTRCRREMRLTSTYPWTEFADKQAYMWQERFHEEHAEEKHVIEVQETKWQRLRL